MKFRKRPVEIEAVKWDGSQESYDKLLAFGCAFTRGMAGALFVHTLEGGMRASQGDWIIKGVKGEFYPCKPDIFEMTYEPVVEERPRIFQ